MPRLPWRSCRLVGVSVALLSIACGGGDSSGPSGGTPGGATDGVLIKGSITGLQGSGLVMQLNGARDITPLAGQLNFFFIDVPKKTSYTITVKTQPVFPSQTCVVGNGIGVANADVDTPTLVCTTNTYSVRGAINGLTGTGLTLLINGGSAQSIPAGANVFAFAGIPSGSSFVVTIGTQPSGQTCTLNNGSNSIGAADVTSVVVTCGAVGFTVGGESSGLGAAGLTLRLNGGVPIAVAAGASAFSFPTTLQSGAEYSVVIVDSPSAPRQSCGLARGKGRIGTANVTNVAINCRTNGTLEAYAGTYAFAINGRRNYLTLWSDGTYSTATRLDDASCNANGNGTEYGVYRRLAAGTFTVLSAYVDGNGGCGLWDSQASPAAGASGTLVRSGNTLTLTSAGGTFVMTAVESVPTSLVGAFTRADGRDGSFVVFEADGSYLHQEAQDAATIGRPVGYERGCYTVTGSSFTVSLATTCRPNGLPALDLNGSAGFSVRNGAAISFQVTSATTVTIDGVLYTRIAPEG